MSNLYTMNVSAKGMRALSATLVLLLSACGGGGSHGGMSGTDPMVPVDSAVDVDPTEQVDPAAFTDAVAAERYARSLASTPPDKADTLEPVSVSAQLAQDDTAEPA